MPKSAVPTDRPSSVGWRSGVPTDWQAGALVPASLPRSSVGPVYAIRVQNIPERHYTEQFMNVCPVNYRQNIQMVRTHTFQRQMQSMIHVKMRNMKRFHNVFQRLSFPAIDEEYYLGTVR